VCWSVVELWVVAGLWVIQKRSDKKDPGRGVFVARVRRWRKVL
jgi:hypothetical protein